VLAGLQRSKMIDVFAGCVVIVDRLECHYFVVSSVGPARGSPRKLGQRRVRF
jgi:hypothetical protein